MKLRSDYTCPLELTHDIIRGKWKPIILWQLSKGRPIWFRLSTFAAKAR